MSPDFKTGNVGPGAQVIQGSNIKVGVTAEELVALLETKGIIRVAEQSGLEQQAVIKLAQRLKPGDMLDFDQALVELEHAVTVALDVITRGERRANQEDFLDVVLARVAENTRVGEFDEGASAIDQALTELDTTYRRSRVALLEEGVKVDTLRRDASSIIRNWVTKYISPGDPAIARMDSEERIHGENGVDDVSAGTADAPGVGALAA
jgi:hypothetical protein